ncbi:MAG: hypothetical protein IKE48_01675 [Parasporobacterium sp.]|nr:hypothetical protein [Parasporobacterium sp.]
MPVSSQSRRPQAQKQKASLHKQEKLFSSNSFSYRTSI